VSNEDAQAVAYSGIIKFHNGEKVLLAAAGHVGETEAQSWSIHVANWDHNGMDVI
jgi:hypothetical protein